MLQAARPEIYMCNKILTSDYYYYYYYYYLHNEELSDLYSLPNIVRVVKSRRMRWAGHVARTGEKRGEVCTRFWWGNLMERDHWGDPDVDGRIILRWIFRKWKVVVGTGWSWLRIGTGEYGDEPSDFKNAGNFLTSCRTS
jgi:hypothetical protein